MTRQMQQLTEALRTIKHLEGEVESLRRGAGEPIAVLGMSCRFPGANNPDALWKLLQSDETGIGEIPPERWNWAEHYDPDPDAPGKMVVREGGFLAGIDRFDAQLFNISPREAALMDPQQRLLLELSWEALENSALSPDRLQGSPGGTFIGISASDYGRLAIANPENLDAYWGTGTVTSVAAGRLSFALGLTGPCLSIDTACSSALVAVHLACAALRRGECDLALAGSVNLMLAPEASIALSKARMLSPAGRCKTFDQDADGYVRSEGAAVLVLKRLAEAERDGDPILALIRGSAINQDGASGGLTVPNGPAQARLIRQALFAAGLEPEAVDYIEAHGTGTALGDPIEVGALASVFAPGRDPDRPLLLGSVKTVLGHLEIAAGMAGLVKTILALRHGTIPGHRQLRRLNRHIPWESLPFQVPREAQAWPGDKKRRIAGVSAFGFSGTNAHVVIEEAPPAQAETADAVTAANDRASRILVLSAKSAPALDRLAGAYSTWIADHPETSVDAVCWTANTGRAMLPHRLAVVAEDLDGLRRGLAAGALRGQARVPEPGVAFLCSGQGAQYPDMGRDLHRRHPVFRAAIERCALGLRPHLDVDLEEILWGGAADRLNETAYTQPALFALEYALTELWQSWGIGPALVLGHSIGEYAAACVAGVFRLEDALHLVAARGRLMQDLPTGGAMAAIFAPAEAVMAMPAPWGERLAVAARNAPEETVVSGERAAVLQFCQALEASRGIRNGGLLKVSHAFHSPLMRPMAASFGAIAEKVRYASPKIAFVSGLTGRLESSRVASAEYWVEQVLAPVDFCGALQTLRENGAGALLEIGPGATLIGLARASGLEAEGAILAASQRRPADGEAEILRALGRLFVGGVTPDWRRAGGAPPPRRKPLLPNYPFQRQRHWLREAAGRRSAASEILPGPAELHPLLGRRLGSAALPEGDFVHETLLGAEDPRYLSDHRVHDKIVVPAAAYAEAALAGLARQFPGRAVVLADLSILSALVLPPGGAKRVQSVFAAVGEGRFRFRFCSTGNMDGEGPWQTHATGELLLSDAAEDGGAAEPAVDLKALRQRFATPDEDLGPEDFYRRLARSGLNYGAHFRGLRRVRRLGNVDGGEGDEVLAEIALPDALCPSLGAYRLHPVLLDGCLQALGIFVPETERAPAYLPVGIERLVCRRPPPARVMAHARLREPLSMAGPRVVADIRMFDETGEVIATVEGLQAVPVDRETLVLALAAWKDMFYGVNWVPAPRNEGAAASPPRPGAGDWLILADRGGLGATLARRLEAEGEAVTLLGPGEIVARDRAAWLAYFARRAQNEAAPIKGIVHLQGLDEAEGADEGIRGGGSPAEPAVRLCAGTLALLQSVLAQADRQVPLLCLVTRGAQAAAEGQTTQVAQAALWGLGRTIMTEHPAFACTCIDLDPEEGARDATDSGADPAADLAADLLRPVGGTQIAYRHGRRLAARLGRLAPSASARRLHPPGPDFRLRAATYGSPDHLSLMAFARPAPAPREVEIEVAAAAVNFKDVLYCLGMLRAFSEQAGIDRAEDQPLGFECSGRVARVGAAVTEFTPGDEVVAMAPSAMASHVTVEARLVRRKPLGLGFEEAAALPTVFMTALHALDRLARLKRGESVLIHAAAGGVGQAALQVAHRAGAVVFATASPAKWPFLKRQGVTSPMHSRRLDFADQILAATGGRGVDVVLNSLSGDAIRRSADTLAPGGRFIEIGKIGIWSRDEMAAYRPDIAYSAFDLGALGEAGGAILADLLDETMREIESGDLRPLPVKEFPLERAPAAFRHLAQAKNIGKVVLSLPGPHAGSGAVRPDRAYLVTGGLGTLGLHVAASLARNGAGEIFLCGRHKPGAAAEAAIGRMREAGACIEVRCLDVADEAALEELLAEIAARERTLGGIVHAAGVLADATLLKQDEKSFAEVLRPKVAGAVNLHRGTVRRHLRLDFFVLFSSAAALLGAPGQANYAAANACLEALGQCRAAQGLPASVLHWGPWAEGGMADRTRAANRARFSSLGLERLAPEAAIEIFEHVLRRSATSSAILDVDWPKFLRSPVAAAAGPFYAGLDGKAFLSPAEKAGSLLERLAEAPAERREALLIASLQGQIAAVLGLAAADAVAADAPLADLGLDSLMTVELKNRLEAGLRCTLTPTLLLDCPTLAALARHLLSRVLDLGAADPPSREAVPGPVPISADADATAGTAPLAAMRESFVGALGRRLCLCRWGAETAPPLVLVHGILDQAASFDAVAGRLVAGGYGVLAPDLRGHGRSDPHPAGANLTVLDYLLDLIAAVAPLEGRRFTLAGHSIGSVVASLYASQWPEKVERLVLIEPVVPHRRDSEAARERLEMDLRYLREAPAHPVYPDLATAARMLRLYHRGLDAGRARALAARITAPCAGGVRWSWDERLRNPLGADLYYSCGHYLSLLEGLKVPSRRIYGTRSQFAGSKVLLDPEQALPLSRSVRIAGGHNLHTDNAEGLAGAILAALRRMPEEERV